MKRNRDYSSPVTNMNMTKSELSSHLAEIDAAIKAAQKRRKTQIAHEFEGRDMGVTMPQDLDLSNLSKKRADLIKKSGFFYAWRTEDFWTSEDVQENRNNWNEAVRSAGSNLTTSAIKTISIKLGFEPEDLKAAISFFA